MTKESESIFANAILRSIEVGDQILLYNSVNDEFHALNLAAKLIWINISRGGGKDSYSQNLVNFFGGETADYKNDIEAILKTFIELEIVVSDQSEYKKITNSEISVIPPTHQLSYESPTVRTYSAEWMKQNHPASFISVKFSDVWNPATPGPK